MVVPIFVELYNVTDAPKFAFLTQCISYEVDIVSGLNTETSSAPEKKFVTFKLFPKFGLTGKDVSVITSLPFKTSTYSVPILSYSYPLAYALPGSSAAEIRFRL